MKVFDAHGDILTNMYWENKRTGTSDSFRRLHHKKYQDGDIFASIFVNFTDPGIDNELIFRDIFNSAIQEIEANQDIMKLCFNSHDLEMAEKEGRIGIVVGVEGLAFLKDPQELKELYALGLRHAALTWNEENKYAGGLRAPKAGLKAAGLKILQGMEKLGMIVDLAHANSRTFFQILEQVNNPVIVSHANCLSLCANKRNLSDEQIIAIGRNGGVIGVTAVANFISEDKEKQTVSELTRHIDHIVKLIGIDHVGIGLDVCYYLDELYTDTRVKGLEDLDKIQNLLAELEKKGYSESAIEKIAYGNFLRIIKKILD